MELQARDKRALIGGAVVVTGLLAFLLWPRGSADSAVELVPADQRQGAAAPVQIPTPPPQPVQPAQPVQATATPIPQGLKLTGVTGRSAIFSFADGSQKLVQTGREVAPGLILQAVRVREVILAVGPTNYRLSLGGPAVAVQAVPVQPVVVVPAAPAAPVVAVPAPPATVPNANLMR